MAQLDHLIVPSRNRHASAAMLAGLLDVPMEPEAMGMFASVFVNSGLTIDFGDGDEFDVHHYCFRVTDEEFDLILARLVAQAVPYRSTPHGSTDMQINTDLDGRIVFWSDADGHYWEMLTVSYARQDAASSR